MIAIISERILSRFSGSWCPLVSQCQRRVTTIEKCLATRPNRSLLLADLLDYVQYLYIVDVRKSPLAGRFWCVHVEESIVERHLWLRPWFCGCVQLVLFVFHLERTGHAAAVCVWGAVFRNFLLTERERNKQWEPSSG